MNRTFIKANVGLLLIALPIPLLLIPARTPIGGAPGIATLVHLLSGASPGFVILIFNLFCFLLAGFFCGWKFGGQTLYAACFLSLVIEMAHRLFPAYALLMPWQQWGAQTVASILMGWGLWWAIQTGFAPAGTAALATIFKKLWHWPIIYSLWGMDFGISVATGMTMGMMTGVRTFFGACVMYLTMTILKGIL